MEDLEQVKNKIKLIDYIKLQGNKVEIHGNNSFKINPCPKCGHKNHFIINVDRNYYHSFAECCKGGDILNYMQEIEGLSFKEAKDKLFKITNTPIEEISINKFDFIKQEPKKDIQRREDTEKIRNFVTTNYNKMEYKKDLISYLESRNINKEAIEKYHLFIALDNNSKRLYIPITKNKDVVGYIGRLIEDKTQEDKKQKAPRYKNSIGSIDIFNSDYLKDKILQEDKIYICEGIFDAISIEQEGQKAISLNSTSNVKKLIEEIKENLETANYFYIIGTDNDDSGKKAKKELQEELTKLNIKNTYLKIPKEYNDINDWYCNTSWEQSEIISDDNIYDKYKEKYTTNYMQDYLRDIEMFTTYPAKKTGFKKLDEELDGGIRSGLYIIGAVPSLGKTTFTLQIADNIAEQGHKVIIFSLEQSKFELVTKSISRLTYSLKGNGTTEAMGHNRILKDKETLYNQNFNKALAYYHNNIAKNQIIEEGNFSTNVDNIRDYIKEYIAVTNERPTIIIDYLQIISPSNTNLSDKQQIEHNVTTLKQISRDYNIPILVISSFNRMNYNQSASFEAFKESGGIEYTADVLLTLQLKILSIQKNITNEDIRNAKKETPRKIEIICLKNRNGKSSFNIDLDFYPAFNIFKDNIV